MKSFNALEKKCTETVDAVVTDFRETVDDDGDTMYAPIFSYDYSNRSYKESHNSYSLNPKYHLNEIVVININPEKPSEFCLPNDNTFKIIGYIFMGVGIFTFLLFSFVFRIIR